MRLPAGLTGLTTTEAAARLREFGPNRLVASRPSADILEFLKMIADPMVLMLLGAAAFYLVLRDRSNALILGVAAIPLLMVDVLLETRARKALRQLASAVAPHATVVRDGNEYEIPTEQIVPGDLIVMREGDVLHADGVVRWVANLATDESQLTGESEPQLKTPCGGEPGADGDESHRFFAGSSVVAGHGYGEVAITGERTRYGQIARLVAEAESEKTPLEIKTARMARTLLAGAIVVAAAIFLLMVARRRTLAEAFLYAITVAVSAVPEEYPLVMTLFLSLGAWRLSRRGVLVRRIASVETLGSTTVICLDKTGTLTKGHYELAQHAPLDGAMSERELLEAAALACELNASDPIDRAIIEHCITHEVDVPGLHTRWRLAYDYPFEMTGKHMSHIWVAKDRDAAHPGGRARIVAKGSLEGILEHCALSPAERARAETANATMADDGMRVLAVAGRWGTDGHARELEGIAHAVDANGGAGGWAFSGVRAEDETQFQLYGLLGFRDPLRPEVVRAVAKCQAAGVRLKLITGDHALTAHAIAEAAGMVHEDDLILTGAELDEISPNRLRAIIGRVAIFARIRPEQKYAIIDALVRAGEVVAMTGDGINDAPALRRASIGIAMGQRGTEVARAAAAMVLLEDDLGALVATIGEGRKIFANIQHAFMFLIGFKVMVISLALVAPAVGLPVMLLLVQLVWLELVVHPVSALLFENNAVAPELMRQPPRSPAAPLVPRGAGMRSAATGLALAAGALGLYAMRMDAGVDYARSAAMAVVIGGSLVLAWSELVGTRSRWKAALPGRTRSWVITAVVAASLPLCMTWSPLAALMHMRMIAPADWGLAALIVVAATGWRAIGWGSAGGALQG